MNEYNMYPIRVDVSFICSGSVSRESRPFSLPLNRVSLSVYVRVNVRPSEAIDDHRVMAANYHCALKYSTVTCDWEGRCCWFLVFWYPCMYRDINFSPIVFLADRKCKKLVFCCVSVPVPLRRDQRDVCSVVTSSSGREARLVIWLTMNCGGSCMISRAWGFFGTCTLYWTRYNHTH